MLDTILMLPWILPSWLYIVCLFVYTVITALLTAVSLFGIGE